MDSAPVQLKSSLSNQIQTVEELSEEYLSDKDQFFEDNDETDMFFCCADWESQLNSVHNEELDLPSALMSPSNRRQTKVSDKLSLTEQVRECSNFFDVDLVMNKQKPGSTGKLLGKRCK